MPHPYGNTIGGGYLVDHYLASLTPKPNLFLFNAGIWLDHDLNDDDMLLSLREALDRHGIRGVYRTTTFRRNERPFEEFMYSQFHKHDYRVCELFECLNVSWTANISWSEYNDPSHFKAPIYNRMILQFVNEILNLTLDEVTQTNLDPPSH